MKYLNFKKHKIFGLTIASCTLVLAACNNQQAVKKYNIVFQNDDGTVLQESKVKKGELPEYLGADPAKDSTAQYDYTWTGWDPEIAPASQDQTYTATYRSTVREYQITFLNGDGSVLETKNVPYGTVPSTALTPVKESSASTNYTFDHWDPTPAEVTGEATYTPVFNGSVRQYSVKFYDEDNLISENEYDYEGAVDDAPSGTFRTFYDIVGYNAKINGEWDSTLLTSIPNVSGDAEYRIVKQLKADKDYLLSDLSDDGDVLGSSWDYNSDIVKSNVSDIPTGATMSNRETSVLIGTKNGIATIKVGADFFNAVKNNEFDDTDYLQIYAKFPVYASGSKYNDIPMVICKGQWYGFNRSAATDNTGDAVFYNGGSYWLKQLSANGGWQQLKIYVSEIKALLAGVPSSNQREWDSLAFPFARNAASPASSKSREVTVYDVEFHRVDITQDFIINDCTNLAQIRACRNTPKANATNNPVALYDTTVPYNYNGTDYPSGKPTTSLKTGDMALNDPVGTGGWNCQSAVDIGFIVDNIDLFDDNDKVVAYLWGFNFYNGWASISSADDTFADSNNIDMTAGNTTYTKHVSGANHRVWVEATITIAELKALTALKYGTVSANYAHTENIYKAQWLNIHIQCGGVGTPNLVYSVELHHAN